MSQEIFLQEIIETENNGVISKSNCAPYFEQRYKPFLRKNYLLTAEHITDTGRIYKQVKESIKIYSFEPDNENYNELVKNVRKKCNYNELWV